MQNPLEFASKKCMDLPSITLRICQARNLSSCKVDDNTTVDPLFDLCYAPKMQRQHTALYQRHATFAMAKGNESTNFIAMCP